MTLNLLKWEKMFEKMKKTASEDEKVLAERKIRFEEKKQIFKNIEKRTPCARGK